MGLRSTLEALSSTGLSDDPYEMVVFTDEPKLPGYLCFPSATCGEGYNTADIVGQGYHPNELHAKVKSVAEMLERLSLSNPWTRFCPNRLNLRDGEISLTRRISALF